MPHLLGPSGAARLAPLALLLLVVLLALAAFGSNDVEEAEAAPARESAYIAVTGEGSTAKGWFDGASPPGVALQEALDKFAAEGYRIVKVTEPHAAISTAGYIWYILLEKGPG